MDSSFANLWTICHPKTNTHGATAVIFGYVYGGKKFELLDTHFPAEGEQMLCFLISYSDSVNKCPFHCSVPYFSHFCSFCWWFYMYNGPQCSAEMLSVVPKHKKKAVEYLTEKLRTSGKPHSGTACATGREFNVDDQQCVLNKTPLKRNTHRTRLFVRLVNENIVTSLPQEPNPVFPLGAQCSALTHSVFIRPL